MGVNAVEGGSVGGRKDGAEPMLEVELAGMLTGGALLRAFSSTSRNSEGFGANGLKEKLGTKGVGGSGTGGVSDNLKIGPENDEDVRVGLGGCGPSGGQDSSGAGACGPR